MKRRRFLTSTTAAAASAAAAVVGCSTPQPSDQLTKDAARAKQSAEDLFRIAGDFPLRPRVNEDGFVLTMEGLLAFVVPRAGIAAGYLDVLAITGHPGHAHVPSLFLPRLAVVPHDDPQHPLKNLATLAKPASLDPAHAIYPLDGTKVRIVGQEVPAAFPNDTEYGKLKLTINDSDVNLADCPTDGDSGNFANFRWVLDLASEVATTPVTVKAWRNTSLYQTWLELRDGRIEDTRDVVRRTKARVGHKWKIKGGTRYLKEVVHLGLGGNSDQSSRKKVYTHIQLTNSQGTSSILVTSQKYFVPAAIMHAPTKYVPASAVVVGYPLNDADSDIHSFGPLLSNPTLQVPKIAELQGCKAGTTPECGCCPPGRVVDVI